MEARENVINKNFVESMIIKLSRNVDRCESTAVR